MIKKSTYIRKFTPKQIKQMEAIQEKEKIKTIPKILLFALEKYHEQLKDNARLNRIIQIKQNKIERLTENT